MFFPHCSPSLNTYIIYVYITLYSAHFTCANCNTLKAEFACNDENFSSFCIFFDVYSAENDLGNALTFFLPTNDAFEAMDKNFDKLTFEENESVLSYHIINEIVHFDELICKGLIVTANGKESRTKCIGDDKYQRGQNQMDNMLPKIIIHDVQVCNGIVHVVDHVLMPKLEK